MILVKPAQQVAGDNQSWSNCIIDFQETSFSLGVTIDVLSFDGMEYQNVTPLSMVFGSQTTAVCTVKAITKALAV